MTFNHACLASLWSMVDRRDRTVDGISPPKHDSRHQEKSTSCPKKGAEEHQTNRTTASSARPPTFTHAPAPVHTLLHQHHINFHHTLEVNMVPSVRSLAICHRDASMWKRLGHVARSRWWRVHQCTQILSYMKAHRTEPTDTKPMIFWML